jgi:hypothetical protein
LTENTTTGWLAAVFTVPVEQNSRSFRVTCPAANVDCLNRLIVANPLTPTSTATATMALFELSVTWD